VRRRVSEVVRLLRHAASDVFDLVTPHVADPELRDLVDLFRERYLARGRCPADDADEETR